MVQHAESHFVQMKLLQLMEAWPTFWLSIKKLIDHLGPNLDFVWCIEL